MLRPYREFPMKHTTENFSSGDHRPQTERVSSARVRRLAALWDASGHPIAPPGYGVRLT